MQNGAILLAAVDMVARETSIFATIWFLIGGIDDLAIDAVFGARWLLGKLRGGAAPPSADTIGLPPVPPRIAIFIPAWDESAVIGAMLRGALARYDYPEYRLYVGCYPNDPATIAAVADVAQRDDRVRLVIGSRPGKTTKADCLNTLWRAMLRDEAGEGRQVDAILLHDAEDVVHPAELRVHADALGRYDAVQIPVQPLPVPGSLWVSGHYCDEFAQAHGKELCVRQALGAGMPLAGVGCSISRSMLCRIAERNGGAPFDPDSLTEDYELGLTVSAMGGSAALVRVCERPGGPVVSVRAYFPETLGAAVKQKGRWLTGIALAGWDRVGWSRAGHVGDHWMRMRDRRATLAMPVLAIAYLALVAWALSLGTHLAVGSAAPDPGPSVHALLWINAGLLLWRCAVRALFVRAIYGNGQALMSVPRMFVSNLVALLAAREAIGHYTEFLVGRRPQWVKTAHRYPGVGEMQAA